MTDIDNLTHLRICLEKPLQIEENIKHKSNSVQHFKKLSAAFLTEKIWPKNSTITVSFVLSENTLKNIDWTPLSVLRGMKVKLDPIEEDIRKLSPVEAIKKIVRERIQPLVGLKFVFVDQGGSVRVGFDPQSGSHSLIGTDCIKSTEPVTMNFAWLDAGTIMHEFGHVLGLIHEHQNPNGKPIQWNDSKVYTWAEQTQGWDQQTTYHNIIERYKIEQLNSSEFDPKSIMLYFFPPSLTTDNKGTTANFRLSKQDVKYISKIYPGGTMSPDQYYKNVYGESLSNDKPGFNWKPFLLIFGGIILMIFLIFFFIKMRKN